VVKDKKAVKHLIARPHSQGLIRKPKEKGHKKKDAIATGNAAPSETDNPTESEC
jgi:hypothetical protein